jgi:hypothetical protein
MRKIERRVFFLTDHFVKAGLIKEGHILYSFFRWNCKKWAKDTAPIVELACSDGRKIMYDIPLTYVP